jgi:hypothetical protein
MPSVLQRYHVLPGRDVTVRVQIGDAQAGGHAVFLGQEMIAQRDESIEANLGSSDSLAGKRLVVSSVAVDIQPMHDHVSVLVELSGGMPDPFPIVLAADAASGGAVSFLTIIDFIA